MPAGRRDVDGLLYVFSRIIGRQANDACIIDAHGEQFLFGNTRGIKFTVPTVVTLHFYVSHGAPLRYQSGIARFGANFGDDPNDYNYTSDVDAIMSGAAKSVETVYGGKESDDYILTKTQRTTEGCLGGRWSNYWGDRTRVTYGDLERFLNHQASNKDIVTVRNRFCRGDMTLSRAITTLRTRGYSYTDIHCCFCRSAQFVGSLPAERIRT
jgi:hypothetical protein